MAFAQVAATSEDRLVWSRCIRGYSGALGTGSIIDPDCTDVGIDGHLDFYMPIEEQDLREIWQTYRMNTESPNSMWHTISDYTHLKVGMTGYKFRRGLFKSDAWLGPLRFFFETKEHGLDKQVDVGFLGASSVFNLFQLFDRWLAGQYPHSRDMDETIKRAV